MIAGNTVPAAEYKSVMVIINPAAGIDRPILGLLNSQFKDTGIKWDVRLTHAAGDAQALARQAVADGYEVVAAHGGDGTVMEVANGLQGTSVPLAIFPGGTANVMASELGVSADLPTCISMVAKRTCSALDMDMATANDLPFLLRVGIGFEADMMKNADQEVKNRFGLLAYAFSAVNTLRTLKPSHYKIEVDGQPSEVDGISCMIANSGNVAIGGLQLSNKIDIADGKLDVVVFTDANLSTILNLSMSVITQADATAAPQIFHKQGQTITVSAEPHQSISLDGELLEADRVTASIMPHVLRVLVPAQQ
ncbi:MAG: diacylglycerol kinase family lipid kinase [Anaerolineae bacterium]|nr:diacylglycerol kinase family lipid kinase [Anaerolineae bacterium]